MTEQIQQKDIKYVKFLVLFMGLVALYDQYLALVEGTLIPYMLKDFKITAVQFAFWQGIFGILTFLVFVIGWYSDAYGRRKGMLMLILVMGVPCLLIVLISQNFFVFMILYSLVIMGTLSNLWELPITEEAPAEKRAIYGSIAFLIGLFPLFALLGGPIAESIGWRWGYGIMFFFMLILLVIWYFKMEETARWTATHEAREKVTLKIKDALKKLDKKDLKFIVMCSIIYGLWTISFKLVASWGGYYFMALQGYSEPEYSRVLLIGALLMMVGAALSGILMEKVGRNFTLLVSCCGSAMSFILLGLTGSTVFYILIFVFMPMCLGWIIVYFGEIFPTEIRSTAVGISATAARVSYVIGPLTASLLLILYPTMGGFWIIAGLFMIIPLAALLIKPYETKGKSLEAVQEER